jgi:hypothetical protein
MAPALLLQPLLVNAREIIRDLAKGWRANLAGGTIVVAISGMPSSTRSWPRSSEGRLG